MPDKLGVDEELDVEEELGLNDWDGVAVAEGDVDCDGLVVALDVCV